MPVFELDEKHGNSRKFYSGHRGKVANLSGNVTRISNKQFRRFKESYEDRFGELPEPFLNLLNTNKIKILAYKIGVKNLNLNEKNCLIKFDFEVFGLTNLIKKLTKYDLKFNGNNIRIFGGINIEELYDFLTRIYELKSNLITN